MLNSVSNLPLLGLLADEAWGSVQKHFLGDATMKTRLMTAVALTFAITFSSAMADDTKVGDAAYNLAVRMTAQAMEVQAAASKSLQDAKTALKTATSAHQRAEAYVEGVNKSKEALGKADTAAQDALAAWALAAKPVQTAIAADPVNMVELGEYETAERVAQTKKQATEEALEKLIASTVNSYKQNDAFSLGVAYDDTVKVTAKQLQKALDGVLKDSKEKVVEAVKAKAEAKKAFDAANRVSRTANNDFLNAVRALALLQQARAAAAKPTAATKVELPAGFLAKFDTLNTRLEALASKMADNSEATTKVATTLLTKQELQQAQAMAQAQRVIDALVKIDPTQDGKFDHLISIVVLENPDWKKLVGYLDTLEKTLGQKDGPNAEQLKKVIALLEQLVPNRKVAKK